MLREKPVKLLVAYVNVRGYVLRSKRNIEIVVYESNRVSHSLVDILLPLSGFWSSLVEWLLLTAEAVYDIEHKISDYYGGQRRGEFEHGDHVHKQILYVGRN